jgi:phosphoenolpyruvate synthase/pyruvate phosphate dikinase
VKKKINPTENMEWIKVVARPATILTFSLVAQGINEEMPRLTGTTLDLKCEKSINDNDLSLYQGKESRERLVKIFENHENGYSFFREHLKIGRKRTKKTLRVGKKIYSYNLNVSIEKLENYWILFKKTYCAFCPFIHIPFIPEEILTNRLKSKIDAYFKKSSPKDKENYFRLLTTIKKDSIFYLEQKDLLEIGILIRKNKNIENRLKNHIKKFGNMGITAHLSSEPYDRKHFLEIINEIKNPKDLLIKLEKNKKEILSGYNSFAKSIPKDIVKLAELLQEYTIFRTERAEGMNVGLHYVKKLTREIGKRFDIKFEDIIWYTVPEIDNLFIRPKKTNVEARKKSFVSSLINGKIYYEEVEKTSDNVSGNEFSGSIAKTGKYTGYVKIITGLDKIKSFKKGEVLVASMTTANLIGAVKKAGAIITDEGGILCHAAIISREFNIPCIIGTKIATQILKDGDLVEVDANKGKIKIIHRKYGKIR